MNFPIHSNNTAAQELGIPRPHNRTQLTVFASAEIKTFTQTDIQGAHYVEIFTNNVLHCEIGEGTEPEDPDVGSLKRGDGGLIPLYLYPIHIRRCRR